MCRLEHLVGKIKIYVGSRPQWAEIVGSFWRAWHTQKARIERAMHVSSEAPAEKKNVGAPTHPLNTQAYVGAMCAKNGALRVP